MPALAQIQPPLVSTISTPRLGADHAPRLGEHERDQPRVLAERRGELARALAGSHPGQRRASGPRPSRPTFCETTSTSPARGSSPASRGRAQRSASPRRAPDLDLRQTADRPDLEPGAHRRAPVARPSSASARAVCGARSGRSPSSRDERREVVGRVEVEAPATRAPRSRPRTRRARPARGGARRCRARRPARSRPPGASSRPLVPVPWRSGITATRPAVIRASAPSSSAGSSSGQSPGSSAEHSAPSASARTIPSVAASEWPRSVWLAQDLERRRRALGMAQRDAARRGPRR